jgi:hypothetical protein
VIFAADRPFNGFIGGLHLVSDATNVVGPRRRNRPRYIPSKTGANHSTMIFGALCPPESHVLFHCCESTGIESHVWETPASIAPFQLSLHCVAPSNAD